MTALNLAQKILDQHLEEGKMEPGEEIGIRIDQTLLQDATGTLAMLEFETLGLDQVKVELAAQYIDHNLLQTDNRNSDDHSFLQHACARYGVHFSRPGNGVSHQVHMERFGRPGMTMIGADSHTPGAAGVSMLAIGAGGLDVTQAMAGSLYYLPCPLILGVNLTGQLPDWVSAKDVILEMLRRYDVKGCTGKIIEYYGPGVTSLSATDRETIANMGAELGATTSVFPSDHRTREYLEAQDRGEHWQELVADDGAAYDEQTNIDLSKIEPLIACPSSPGNVVPVREVAGKKVDQVIVGSSVNSSFRDLMVVARIMHDQHCAPHTSFHINPGSRQVLENVAEHGGVTSLLRSGALIQQSGCLGCIGMGQAPGTGQVSLRTFPRNFPGRSGTMNDQVYLCSPETAAAAALTGKITDPRELEDQMNYPRIQDPARYMIDDSSIIFPGKQLMVSDFERGPNIKPLPDFEPMPDSLEGEVIIRVKDNISTDTIMPAGNQVLPLRSNIEAISEYVFYKIQPAFHQRCKERDNCIVVAGENYGQGSSREHAALAPRYLGIRVKIAKSFARIHKANLCNFGILPLVFENPEDYALFEEGEQICLPNVRKLLEGGKKIIPVHIGESIVNTLLDVSRRQREHILTGGTLNYLKQQLH